MAKQKLNKIQLQAVESIDKPVLIFAGAGSGKTRVLIHKIAYLIDKKHYKAENILSVTFTNKAAKEMRERASKLLGSDKLSITIGTFHSICARILRKEAKYLNLSSQFVIYDVQDQIDLIKILLTKLDVSKNILTPNKARNIISGLKSKIIMPDDQLKRARTNFDKVLAELYALYQGELRNNEALDFDDLLLLPLELFDKNPEILEKYQNKWKYILVDEYQDTNKPQFEFLIKLSKASKKICVVGDDDQSIYGWRGADIGHILDFEKNIS
jgi:DNA helicase-2/ATP-dependent DNA helicase PcrA